MQTSKPCLATEYVSISIYYYSVQVQLVRDVRSTEYDKLYAVHGVYGEPSTYGVQIIEFKTAQ